MVEINKNTTINKVPASKNRPSEAPQEATPVNPLEEKLESLDARMGSIYKVNELMRDRLKIVQEDNLSIIIPREYIKGLVESVVESRKNELVEKIADAECMLDELNLEKNREALEGLEDLSNMSDRLDEVEYSMDDKMDCNQVEDEIENMTGEYVPEYEINDKISDALDEAKITELKSRVDGLIGNRWYRVCTNKFKQLINWIKSLFTTRK